eukprot:scaffold7675_cov277-Pinguiococcus_pyrenoidosus.AAC.1
MQLQSPVDDGVLQEAADGMLAEVHEGGLGHGRQRKPQQGRIQEDDVQESANESLDRIQDVRIPPRHVHRDRCHLWQEDRRPTARFCPRTRVAAHIDDARGLHRRTRAQLRGGGEAAFHGVLVEPVALPGSCEPEAIEALQILAKAQRSLGGVGGVLRVGHDHLLVKKLGLWLLGGIQRDEHVVAALQALELVQPVADEDGLGLTRRRGVLEVVPAGPRGLALGHEAGVRVQVHLVVRVRDRPQGMQDLGRRPVQNLGGDVRVACEEHVIEELRGLLSVANKGELPVAVVHARHLLDVAAEAESGAQDAGDLPHILFASSAGREPLRPPEQLQHLVVGEEGDDRLRRRRQHFRSRRAPQRGVHGHQVQVLEGLAVLVRLEPVAHAQHVHEHEREAEAEEVGERRQRVEAGPLQRAVVHTGAKAHVRVQALHSQVAEQPRHVGVILQIVHHEAAVHFGAVRQSLRVRVAARLRGRLEDGHVHAAVLHQVIRGRQPRRACAHHSHTISRLGARVRRRVSPAAIRAAARRKLLPSAVPHRTARKMAPKEFELRDHAAE